MSVLPDLLFKTPEFIFSYRVAGVCMRDDKVLLQTCPGDSGYAFPGGHVACGETNEMTLRREFEEEMGASVSVGALKWVGEIFFRWGEKPCHQICLYYDVQLQHNPPFLKQPVFDGREELSGQAFHLQFHWVPLSQIGEIDLYPTNAVPLLTNPQSGVQHFVYQEGDVRFPTK